MANSRADLCPPCINVASSLNRRKPGQGRVVERDEHMSVKFVVGKGIVSPGRIAVAIDKGVVPHVFVAKPACFQDGSNGALKFNFFPSSIEEAHVLGIVWITADKIGPRAGTVEPNDIRQGRFEQQWFVWIAKVIKVKKTIDIPFGHAFCPSTLCCNDFGLRHRLEIAFRNRLSPSLAKRRHQASDKKLSGQRLLLSIWAVVSKAMERSRQVPLAGRRRVWSRSLVHLVGQRLVTSRMSFIATSDLGTTRFSATNPHGLASIPISRRGGHLVFMISELITSAWIYPKRWCTATNGVATAGLLPRADGSAAWRQLADRTFVNRRVETSIRARND